MLYIKMINFGKLAYEKRLWDLIESIQSFFKKVIFYDQFVPIVSNFTIQTKLKVLC